MKLKHYTGQGKGKNTMTKKDYIVIANALKISMPKSLLISNDIKNQLMHSQWWNTTNAIVKELRAEKERSKDEPTKKLDEIIKDLKP